MLINQYGAKVDIIFNYGTKNQDGRSQDTGQSGLLTSYPERKKCKKIFVQSEEK